MVSRTKDNGRDGPLKQREKGIRPFYDDIRMIFVAGIVRPQLKVKSKMIT